MSAACSGCSRSSTECLHFTTYFGWTNFFALGEIVKDIGKRPFITAGFAAFIVLLPMAITSTAGWIRRLGGKRWQMLHRLDLLQCCRAAWCIIIGW